MWHRPSQFDERWLRISENLFNDYPYRSAIG
jgi:hypothetical protein